MNWASHAIEKLKSGQEAIIKPKGNSMKGLIESGQEVKLQPINADLKVNDIVLVKVKGKTYLHLIKAIENNRYLIGNNRGGINGWVGSDSIYGVKC